MDYIIWHTNRTGSSLLSNLLHKTGVAGIVDYEKCGFHTPQMYHKHCSEQEFEKLTEEYLDMQRTVNGVSGCKGGLLYIDLIRKYVTRQAALNWAIGFDKHIHLMRRDKVAQAVSALFAGQTKLFTSNSLPNDRPMPDYNYDVISYALAELQGEAMRTEIFLSEQGIRYLTVYYEDLIGNISGSIRRIIEFLGIEDKYKIRSPDIKKQLHPLKTEYIQRYYKERKEHGPDRISYPADSPE